MSRRLLGVAAVLALGLGACTVGPPQPSGVSLSIGVDAQLTGPEAASGKAVLDAVNRAKPSGAKGQYLQGMTIAATMGPGIKVDIPSLLAVAAAA